MNPAAKVSVKLVAEAGIGTVASGVAKANADVIQVQLFLISPPAKVSRAIDATENLQIIFFKLK